MAIAFVNSTGITIATGASTWSCPVQTGLTGGGALIVGIGCNTGVTVNAVTDNAGNVYSFVVRANAPSTSAAELWYTNGASSLSTRISVTLSGNSSGSIGIGHWTGISTGRPVIASGSSAVNANSTTHGASEITATSNALFVSFCRLTQSTLGTITNLDGMTTWISTQATATVRTHGMYKILGASGSTNSGSFTTSSNAQHAGVVAAFSDTAAPLRGWSSFMVLGVQ